MTPVISPPVAGVLVAGYWVVDRTRLDLAGLYTRGGRYWYSGGWNWRAVLATAVGGLLAVGGAWSAPGQGPFPLAGFIPPLKGLYDYSWVIGFAAGFLVYLVLALIAPAKSAGRAVAVTAPHE